MKTDTAKNRLKTPASWMAAVLAAAMLLTEPAAQAATVIVPASAAATDQGNGSSLLSSAIRLQQVYGAALFPAGTLRIEEIRLRPSARFGQSFSATISNLQIRLSTTAAHAEVLNAQFETNHGSNKAVGFAGAASISSAFTGPAGGPKDFDIRIPLTNPFLYEPAAGNLLIDWQNFSGSTSTFVDAAGSSTDLSSRAFALGGATTAATTVDNGAELLELVYTLVTNPPPVVPPTIVGHPQSTNVLVGQSAFFSVGVTGDLPRTFQWRFNGGSLPAGTNATLLLANVGLGQAGGYDVVVANAGGSATSAVATLTVSNLPSSTCPGGVVPLVFQNVEAGGGSSVLHNAIRLQEIYGAQNFPTQAVLITEIRMRPSAVSGAAFSGGISNLQVNLSTTPRLPDGLRAVFAENPGSNDTVVFSGTLPLSSSFAGPAAGPKDFDIIIPLQTPFRHDPTQGSLLVDFRNFSGGPAVTFVDAGAAPGDGASRAFALGASTATASTRDTGADVLRFCYTILTNTPPPVVPPAIVGQPQSTNVLVGQSAFFSVEVTGDLPRTHQWRFNSNPLPGGTNNTLLLTDVGLGQAGGYDVVVANAGGSATSAVATLTVSNSPVATCPGSVVPLVFQNVEASAGSSVLRDAIRLQEVYGAQNFPAQVVLISEIRLRPSAVSGTAFSGVISNLQVNLSTTPRLPDGLSAVFAENPGSNDTVVFSGTLPLSSSFAGPAAGPKDFDIIIPLQTPFRHDPTQGSLLVDFRNFSGGPAVTFVDAGAAPNDSASRAFALGASTSTASTRDTGADVLRFCYTILTNPPPPVVVPPTIVLQPRDTNVFVGQTVLMHVGATGTAPLRYQWYFENLPLPGRTSPFLLLSNVQPSQAGQYYAIVTNLAGSAISSNALLVVNIPSNRPPAAFTQTRSVPEDSSVQVFLSGSDPDGNPLTYSIMTPPAHDTLSGTLPDLNYTPAPNFIGTDFFQFQVSDGQLSSAPATVTLQVTPVDDPPTVIATVSPLFSFGNGDTNWYILATNGTEAAVVLDASFSSDPDGTPLNFLWYLSGETEPFGLGSTVTNTLPVGPQLVLLITSDEGRTSGSTLSFEVVTPGDLVEELMARIEASSLSRKDKRPLLEALKKASGDFERGKLKQALDKLEHFQRKIRTHVSRDYPQLAGEWTAFADQILDAFGR